MLYPILAIVPASVDAAAIPNATGFEWFMLAFYLSLAVGVSFLCSLLEAGILSLPASQIEVLAQSGKKSGLKLRAMKNNIDRPLSAILTLNTIAHTIGAAGTGAQILKIGGSEWVALGSVIITVLILVLSEIIPKSLGAAYAKRLAPFTAWAIQVMIWITLPVIIPLQWISRALGGGHGAVMTRAEFAVTAELGGTAGVLNPAENLVIRNLLTLGQVTVHDVMTPRPVMFTLSRELTVNQALAQYPEIRFSRIPLHQGNSDHLVGHVTRHAILKASHHEQGERTLGDLMKPLGEVQENESVAAILERMTAQREHIVAVKDEFGGTSGLVTLEDCIETLLGVEIVDETDSVEDMREAARALMARRRDNADD
ncbi:CNNM domain-containing protein [Rubripirellula reticaptiva]|uniref:Magnesium and cobalt efflux protein CorC n=1 Tax=Rubripirellula reticaptiva TaxID=2528013 RepID=A0A5C6F677_9BACT|nr:hemolysin family protein [Rubripirellula reticaptiva]TWU55339.1 Magnesium and cobalt efflux protein CorC [Rubripirellula reticaptiva]